MAMRAKLDVQQTGRRIAFNLGKATAILVKSGFRGTLCIFGGDTLACIVHELGVTCIIPISEVQNGVVLSKLCENDNELYIISKSGSFGDIDVIEKINEQLIRGEMLS